MTVKKPVLAAAVAVALVAALVVVWLVRRAGPEGPIEASGTVEALETDLGFPLPGRIDRIAVEEGDRVAKGQEVAALDRSRLEAVKAQAEAQAEAARARLAELEHGTRPEVVAQAEAALSAAEQALDQAEKDHDRAKALYEGEAIPKEKLDRAETALASARAERDRATEQLKLARTGPRTEEIEAQRALLRQARAGIDQADAALADAVLTVPFAGVVTIRHRDPGETVPAGAPVVTVMDLDDRWVRIYVREDAIGRVHVGQAATIAYDSRPGKRYDGRVTYVSDEAEFTPSNVQTEAERVKLVYAVKVRITGDRERDLKVGTPADVRLAAAP